MVRRSKPSIQSDNHDLQVLAKIQRLPLMYLLVSTLICCVGFTLLYSAARGDIQTWAMPQMIRFGIGLIITLIIAIVHIRVWYMLSYLAYLMGIGFLIMVMAIGVEGGLGAQRWINIGGFQFQPSEMMKIFIVMALARYYHALHIQQVSKITTMIVPGILIGVAALLILKQPNLGTAAITAMLSGIILFLAGINWKYFAIAGIAVACMLPIGWHYMHDYQKKRVETFLDPTQDPLGSGYNIIQSQIAIGSGGFAGKGLMQGSQSQLNFVPEKQTDFIFAVLSEEFGFLGCMSILAMYAALIIMGTRIAMQSASTYGRLLAAGITSVIFLHVFINCGMVIGIMPVVGVPLPLLSYGGSSLLSMQIGLGLVMNVLIHKDEPIAIGLK